MNPELLIFLIGVGVGVGCGIMHECPVTGAVLALASVTLGMVLLP